MASRQRSSGPNSCAAISKTNSSTTAWSTASRWGESASLSTLLASHCSWRARQRPLSQDKSCLSMAGSPRHNRGQAERRQHLLKLFSIRFQPGRQFQTGSQLLDWLIHREAGGIGRNLEQDASRFAKINRVEV